MIGPEVGRIETIWPTSVGGWVGLAAGTSALVFLVIDRLTARGKNLATIDRKLDGLCEQVETMESDLKVVDGLSGTVRELMQEWRGPPGRPNGFLNKILKNEDRITAIERRIYEYDAIKKAMDEDDRRGHGQHRRAMDRVVSKLIPEEREEKG